MLVTKVLVLSRGVLTENYRSTENGDTEAVETQLMRFCPKKVGGRDPAPADNLVTHKDRQTITRAAGK